MATIIDRRENYRNRSSGSRQRFIKRYKDHIKEGVDKTLRDSKGITDILNGNGKGKTPIKVRKKDVDEPNFSHGKGGSTERIVSGNKTYKPGDRVQKPNGGGMGGRGQQGSPDGEGEDEFTFYMNREEFIDILFEDLELPDLVKRSLLDANVRELQHDGFAKSGPPGQLDVRRSFSNSLARRIGLNRKPLKEELKRLEAELLAVQQAWGKDAREGYDSASLDFALQEHEEKIAELETKIDKIKRKLMAIPFIDDIDLRFRQKDWVQQPTTSAVMFAIMDVSGSMGEHEKTISKLFFFLLFLFLKRNYHNVQIVFIRHTHVAKEVDEQEFFYGTESGGTIVSTALELCHDIIKERYDSAVWNVYVAQCSDGDDFDPSQCQDILINKLLPIIQYMVYVQIDHDWSELVYRQGVKSEEPTNGLWRAYREVQKKAENLDMRVIGQKKDIYPVFRKLFEKKLK